MTIRLRPVRGGGDLLGISGEATLADAFRSIVAAQPGSVAVHDGEAHTYADLDARSSSVAAAVLEASSPGPDPVLILADQSATAVAALMGVAKSGHPFLALDPRTPEKHLVSIASRALANGARVLLTDSAHRGALSTLRMRAIDVTSVPSADDPFLDQDPGAAALVSFTSGTSGTPKGVIHAHRSVVRNARRVAAAVGVDQADRLLVGSPFAFVGSMTPTFASLLTGAGLCPYDFGTRGAEPFADFAQAVGLTVVQLSPGLLPSLARLAESRGPIAGIRVVLVGGDRLQAPHLRAIRTAFPDASVLQRYSTSETNWIAGGWLDGPDIEDGEQIPLGWPLPWVDARVVGEAGEQVPTGVVGELVVRSDGLALGYLGDDRLTRERFVSSPGGREYWTRDRVRMRREGMLEFVGRVDATAKVRGVLVDPATVEHVIETLPGVSAAAVVTAMPDGAASARVIAFVAGQGLRPRNVRREVAMRLPAAMVPAAVVPVLELPLTSRGKVDTGRLREAAARLPRAEYVEPRDATERHVATIFARVLSIDAVGRDDDFYALGGDSLASAELLAIVEDEFGLTITPTSFLGSPTPALLARLLQSPPRPRGRADPHLVQVCRGRDDLAPCVLFSGGGGVHAEGMAALARELDDRSCYVVIPRAFDYRGRPDRSIPEIARSAFNDIETMLPEGPLILAGHSSGGSVAMETARSLLEAGRDVALVVALDSRPCTPAFARRRTLISRSRRFAEKARAARARQGRESTLVHVAYWRTKEAWRMARRHAEAQIAGRIRFGYERQMRHFQSLVRVGMPRHRETEYPGCVLIITATEYGNRLPPTLSLVDEWRTVLTGAVRVDSVSCEHALMTSEPYVREVGRIVRTTLAGIGRPEGGRG